MHRGVDVNRTIMNSHAHNFPVENGSVLHRSAGGVRLWSFARGLVVGFVHAKPAHRPLAEAGRDRVRLNKSETALVLQALDPNSLVGKRRRPSRRPVLDAIR